MEGFNKILSFFLGLVVVIVFVIVLSNRLNLKSKFIPFQASNTKVAPTVTPSVTPTPEPGEVTPTPTKKPGFFQRMFAKKTTPTPSPTKSPEDQTATYVITTKPTVSPQDQTKGGQQGQITPSAASTHKTTPYQKIPATGVPILFYPVTLAAGAFGLKLRRSGQK